MTEHPTDTPGAVSITLGEGAELMVDKAGKLSIVTRRKGLVHDRIWLGEATTKRFADLISYTHRLSIHAVDAYPQPKPTYTATDPFPESNPGVQF